MAARTLALPSAAFRIALGLLGGGRGHEEACTPWRCESIRAALGWAIFTAGLGIGDDDMFDWGGVLSALIGVVIVLLLTSLILRCSGRAPGFASLVSRVTSSVRSVRYPSSPVALSVGAPTGFDSGEPRWRR